MAKHRYIIIDEEYEVWGTNDLAQATEASEFQIVFDVETGLAIGNEDDNPNFGIQTEIRLWPVDKNKPAEAGFSEPPVWP